MSDTFYLQLETLTFADQKVRLHFASAGLDRTAINTVYSHVLNPMITSRSYMSIEPIELWLDTRALRRGLVYPVDPDSDPSSLCVQDSGMVPISTQIAIVNPETNILCHIGEYGEIWVQSEACAKAFYASKQEFDLERFNGRTVDGDPRSVYVRTGDLGFLHNVTRPIGAGGQAVEMQVLFVLGSIGETFEVNGLNHFPLDIEGSVEKCHRNISAGGCAVFQAGGLVVVLVEVFRKAYLASMVPVIVNAILNEHQLVIDIVAFVSNGDFPRSRLGEKQRGKILASWVTRKLRTIAQFAIRDADGSDSQITEVPEPRSSTLTSKPGRQSIFHQAPSISAPPGEPGFGDGWMTSPAPYNPDEIVERHKSDTDPQAKIQTPIVALNDQPYSQPPSISDNAPSTASKNSKQPSEYKVHSLEDAPYTLDYESPPIEPEAALGDSQRAPREADPVFPKRTTSMRAPPTKLIVANPETFDAVEESPDETPPTMSAASTTAPTFSSLQQTESASSYSTRDIESPYDSSANPFINLPDRTISNDSNELPLQSPDLPMPLNPRRLSQEPASSARPNPTPTGSRPTSYFGGRTTLPSQQARYSSYGSLTPGATSPGLRIANPDGSGDEASPDSPPDRSRTPQPPVVNYQRKPSLTSQTSPPLLSPTHDQQQSLLPPQSSRGLYDDEDDNDLYEDYPREALAYTSDPADRARILRDRMGTMRRSNRDTVIGPSGGNSLSVNGGDEPSSGRDRGNSIAASDVSSVAGSVRRRYDGSDW